MKVLASLLRVVFSILVLLALACYMQAAPTVSLNEFYNSLDSAQILNMLCGFNAVTVSLGIILLLGILSFTRVLEAAWNVAFCASILVLLALGLYSICGPAIALPQVLCHNTTVNQICQTAAGYEVPIAIITLIFIAGWFCASACGRVAITAVVSYGLWYGLTALLTYAVHLWGSSENPAMPEALSMMQSTPWVIAAVPGAFFLIYALFMAFFETFISNKSPKAEKTPAKEERKEDKAKADNPEPTENKEEAKNVKKAEPEKKPLIKPVEPVTKPQPVLKVTPVSAAPLKKLKPATPADEVKKEEKPETKEDPKPVAKEEPEAEVKEEPKPESKEEPKPVAKEEPKPEPKEAPRPEAKETEKPEAKVEDTPSSKEEDEIKDEAKP